jgi:hypothetical protein
VGAIGDATCDAAPLQVGQFESGNEIEEDLSRLFLEGGGGGQQTESYELGLYFLARKTALDCFEKRGEKGYAFLIGDEMPYPRLKRREVERLVGDTIDADVPVAELIAEARKRWEIFYIIPKLSHYYNDSKILARWRELLGQSVIKLEDPSAISELIASTIGLAEETVDKAGLAADLKEAGVAPGAIDAVASALKGGVGRDISGTGLRAL